MLKNTDTELNLDTDEEILWAGNQSSAAKTKRNFFYGLFWAIGLSIVVLIGFLTKIISLFITAFIFGFIVFFFLLIDLSGKSRAYYIISTKKIYRRFLDEYESISTTETLYYKVKKSFFDSRKFETGSIYFYTTNKALKGRPFMLDDIEYVSKVNLLLKENFPNINEKNGG